MYKYNPGQPNIPQQVIFRCCNGLYRLSCYYKYTINAQLLFTVIAFVIYNNIYVSHNLTASCANFKNN